MAVAGQNKVIYITNKNDLINDKKYPYVNDVYNLIKYLLHYQYSHEVHPQFAIKNTILIIQRHTITK